MMWTTKLLIGYWRDNWSRGYSVLIYIIVRIPIEHQRAFPSVYSARRKWSGIVMFY